MPGSGGSLLALRPGQGVRLVHASTTIQAAWRAWRLRRALVDSVCDEFREICAAVGEALGGHASQKPPRVAKTHATGKRARPLSKARGCVRDTSLACVPGERGDVDELLPKCWRPDHAARAPRAAIAGSATEAAGAAAPEGKRPQPAPPLCLCHPTVFLPACPS